MSIDEVRALSAERDAILIGNDASLIAAHMTEDWVKVGQTGITPKADIIGWIASGRLAHHAMTTVGGERAALAGDTVLLTARRVSSGTWDGAPYTADEWMTDVYVRADGAWRCAFTQTTEASG